MSSVDSTHKNIFFVMQFIFPGLMDRVRLYVQPSKASKVPNLLKYRKSHLSRHFSYSISSVHEYHTFVICIDK